MVDSIRIEIVISAKDTYGADVTVAEVLSKLMANDRFTLSDLEVLQVTAKLVKE